jgi:hypothetical protein
LRELLRLVYDRLQERPVGYGNELGGSEGRVTRLVELIGEVLADGIFDGRMTEIDMRQLPPALR